jgi:serine/threonine-protein kinase HipA
MVEQISDAVSETAPIVRELMNRLTGFKDTGKRMLATWSEGVKVLREERMYALGPWETNRAFEGISDPPKLENPHTAIGSSELLADRSKSRKRATLRNGSE